MKAKVGAQEEGLVKFAMMDPLRSDTISNVQGIALTARQDGNSQNGNSAATAKRENGVLKYFLLKGSLSLL